MGWVAMGGGLISHVLLCMRSCHCRDFNVSINMTRLWRGLNVPVTLAYRKTNLIWCGGWVGDSYLDLSSIMIFQVTQIYWSFV
jgi:hypothetical protein